MTWSSLDTIVASVSESGVVRARGNGSTSIDARSGGVSARATVRVQQVPASIVVTPATVSLVGNGARVQLTAAVRDLAGVPLVLPVVTWFSANAAVAIVDSTGMIVATGRGATTIIARAGTHSDTVAVVVATANLCGTYGAAHSGEIDSETWRLADSPHCLEGSVTVRGGSTLTIEAGVTVRALPNATLILTGNPITGAESRLDARGTADSPILLTAHDASSPWGGITGLPGIITLRHVRLEHALIGVHAYGGSDAGQMTATITRSHLRQIRASALAPLGVTTNFVVDSCVVDTAGLDGSNAVTLGMGNRIRVAHTVIRGSGGAGIGLTRGGGIELSGVRIEGSRSYGIYSGMYSFAITSSAPVRITGSGNYPVNVDATVFAALWPRRADQDSLLGNVRDTIYVTSAPRDIVVRPELPWIVSSPYAAAENITLEAGAALTVRNGSLSLTRPILLGTAAMPVTLRGSGPAAAVSINSAAAALRHLRLDSLELRIDSADAQLEDIRGLGARLRLRGRGARLANVLLEGGSSGYAASDSASIILLAPSTLSAIRVQRSVANGINIAADSVNIRDCQVSASGRDGIRVLSGAGVTIQGCDLTANAGAGVSNTGTDAVIATLNWWGDPAGPTGPSGDGVVGNVVVAPFLAAPNPFILAALRGR